MSSENQVPQIIKNSGKKAVIPYMHLIPYKPNSQTIKVTVAESEEVIICCKQACEFIKNSGLFALLPSTFPQIFANHCKKAPIEIYYVNKDSKLEIPWGTDIPISVQDPNTKIYVNILSHGQLDLAVNDIRKLFKKLDDIQCTVENDEYLKDFLFQQLLIPIKRLLADAIVHTEENVLKACSCKEGVSLYIEENLQQIVLEYGFKLEKFSINNLKIEANQQFEQLQRALQRNEQLERLSKIRSPDSSFPTINYIETISNCGQVQVGTINSQQTNGLTATEIQLIFDEIVSSLSEMRLQANEKEKILSELQKIRDELEKKSPQKTVISNALGTIRNISEGIAGSIIASGIIWKLGLFLT